MKLCNSDNHYTTAPNLYTTAPQGLCPNLLKTYCGFKNGDIAAVHSFLTGSNLSHRYGASHTNQRIENWWSHFKRSFTVWVIDYFKQLVHDGIFVHGNIVHMECISFVYADFLQRKLDEVKNEWNPYTIRYTKGCQVSGIPNQFFYLPELKGYALQGHHLSEVDIVNIFQQMNFEEEFEQIMEESKSQLQEYFRYIASSQQMSHPPSDWDNPKKLFIEIIDAAEK